MNENNKTKEKKVGFIGCGHMASAIIQGVLGSSFLPHSNVCASEVSEDFAKNKKNELGIEVFTDNEILAKNSDVIFLATKPNAVTEVLAGIKNHLSSDKLVVSIAAGVSTKKIEDAIGKDVPVVRVMPNGPAMIQEGMSGIAKGKWANAGHIEFVQELLSNIGKCIVVDEDKIDIVTAISGSGPAFFYEIIHEMALAGEKLGLDYDKSLLLAAQTAIGSAKVMLESEFTPAELVQKISTKGGCTEVGVEYMYERDTKELFYEIIKRTADKANALGK